MKADPSEQADAQTLAKADDEEEQQQQPHANNGCIEYARVQNLHSLFSAPSANLVASWPASASISGDFIALALVALDSTVTIQPV